MKMYKHISAVLILALTACLVYQQQTINTIAHRTDRLDEHLLELSGRLMQEETTVALLQKIVMANSKKILNSENRRILTVTAYSPRKCETDSDPFITATNNRVRAGIIAVSRDLFDKGWVFGKKVYIKNMGIFTIDDLMASSKRQQVDIFMHDTGKAVQFGKKQLEVYLLEA
jgi:3D (Asp-Asp-Asp) domain-containing protein